MIKIHLVIVLSIIAVFSLLFISVLYSAPSHRTSIVMMLSVSSDGQYAVSSHLNGEIILWDITKHSKKLIARHANIYSAYFIKHSHWLMWQDINNIVHIQDINGKSILQFQNRFPVYGQVMSNDLTQYFTSDEYWNLYEGLGISQTLIKSAYDINGFISSGKLLNLTLSSDCHFLLTSGDAEHAYDEVPLQIGNDVKSAVHHGYDVGPINASLLEGVVLWNAHSGKPIHKLPGNEVKTFATISSDNKYLISGDENEFLLVWNAKTGKKYYTVSNAILDIPKDINDPLLKNHINAILTLKFIDNHHDYLRFNYRSFNYAVLYNVANPNPLKFISLGKNIWPAVNDFSRDEAIDTAPDANILVMGQADGSGIIVYRYYLFAKTLQKVWETTAPI
jgi:WD40 repeat protein